MAVSVGGEDDGKPMDMESGTAGDDDEKMTEAEKAGGGPRVTAQRVSAAADATRREAPTVNPEKIRLEETQSLSLQHDASQPDSPGTQRPSRPRNRATKKTETASKNERQRKCNPQRGKMERASDVNNVADRTETPSSRQS